MRMRARARHHPQQFDEIDWAQAVGSPMEGVHVVVPILVVDEIDNLKWSYDK
jgi:hypothetical protein